MKKRIFIILCVIAVLALAGSIYFVYQEHKIRKASDLYYKAKDLDAKGKYDEALSIFRESERLNPKSGKTHLMLGVVYTRKSDFKKAEEELLKALKYKMDSRNLAITHHNLGAIYVEHMEKPDQAITEFNLAVKTDPGFFDPTSDPYFGLSRAYILKGDYDSAIKAAEQSIKLNQKSDKGYISLGIAYTLKQEPDSARKVYEELKEKNKKAAEEFRAIINSWQMFTFIIPEIKKTGAVPEETRTFLKRIGAYSSMGDKEGIEKLSRKRLQKNPKDILARILLYSYFVDNNDIKSARAALVDGLQGNKDDYALLMTLGVSYLAGRENVTYDRIFSANQAYLDASIFNGVSDEDLAQAENYFLKAYNYYPGFSYPVFYLAKIYERKKEPDKALSFWQAALRLSPSDVSSALSYARLLLSQKGPVDEVGLFLKDLLAKQQYNYFNAPICELLSKYYSEKKDSENSVLFARLAVFYRWLIPCATSKYRPDFDDILKYLAVFPAASAAESAAGTQENINKAIKRLGEEPDIYATEFLASIVWNGRPRYNADMQEDSFVALEKKGKAAFPYYLFLGDAKAGLRERIMVSIQNINSGKKDTGQ